MCQVRDEGAGTPPTGGTNDGTKRSERRDPTHRRRDRTGSSGGSRTGNRRWEIATAEPTCPRRPRSRTRATSASPAERDRRTERAPTPLPHGTIATADRRPEGGDGRRGRRTPCWPTSAPPRRRLRRRALRLCPVPPLLRRGLRPCGRATTAIGGAVPRA